MGSKPPAAVVVRVSKDGRHDLGAASPLSTTTSYLQGRAGGSAIMLKLVELVIGPGSTRQAGKLSPCIACTAVAAPSVRSRVFVFAGQSASMARRGCRASCFRRVKTLIYTSPLSKKLIYFRVQLFEDFFHHSIYILQCGLARPEFFLLGDGAIVLGDSLALLPWRLRVTSTSRTLVCSYTLARGKGKGFGNMM